jgi:xylulokinase
MRKMPVAGVDCSTQATKVVVVDAETGAFLASGRCENIVHRAGAASETDPENWWQSLRTALERTGYADRIAAISIAAQQLGVVTLDRDKNPVRPAILWDDTRSAHTATELRQALGGAPEWARLVGTQPMAGLSVCSWAWLKRHEPENINRTAFVRLPHDFLTERLTGQDVTDRGDASGTGWWSGQTGDYVQEVLNLPQVQLERSMLPRIIGPSETAGQVLPEAARFTGLPAGIAVACGTGDNMAAALALASDTGTPVISLGTSGTAYVRSHVPAADPTGQVLADASASGDFLPLTCTLNATLAVDNFARLLGITREDVSRRTNVVVLPYLSGERLPDYPLARGAITGIDHATTASQILLAAYEGVAYSLVRSLDALELHSSGIDPDAPIILVGGGARGKVWQDTIVRLSGRELIVPVCEELAAWGAAVQAAAVLAGEHPDTIAGRWNIAKGLRVAAGPVDTEAVERISAVRTATHELNQSDIFSGIAPDMAI